MCSRHPLLRHLPAMLGFCALVTVAVLAACDPQSKDGASPSRLSSSPLPAGLSESFSGEKAYGHVEHLVSLGPRPPASEAFEKQLAYLEQTLAGFGWKTSRQSFPASTPEGPVTFTNLLARHESAAPLPDSLPVLIGGHIDTKKLPFEFVGANDSGSSTGILLELARVLALDPDSAASVELLFFDGEEAFRPGITASDGLYGSKYFARSMSTRPSWPAIGIVLDIVGDPNHPLLVSPEAPESFKEAVFDIAGRLKFPSGVKPSPGPILDDHVPLQQTGLPCLHLIGDFQAMDYWHQPGDTLGNLTPEMLEKVGHLTLDFLADPRAHSSAPSEKD